MSNQKPAAPVSKSNRLEVTSDELRDIQNQVRIERLMTDNPSRIYSSTSSSSSSTNADNKNKTSKLTNTEMCLKAKEMMEKLKEENNKEITISSDPELVLIETEDNDDDE